MEAAMRFLLFTSIAYSLVSLSASENLETEQDPLSKTSLLDKLARRKSFQRVKRQEYTIQGLTRPFCDMFGCHYCTTPPGHKCCEGFMYDAEAKRCREIFM
ncbi:hypothetical protein CDAR_492421 [Caerostris darwini]|uniref:Uncharacterized protein n=1 Tax=Caerostris darwini TaxID=1538125 RepID=A0AAV4V0Q4_9ARAC|nr:hypothetical protein CDAR_492421 [Caerostris darwini]